MKWPNVAHRHYILELPITPVDRFRYTENIDTSGTQTVTQAHQLQMFLQDSLGFSNQK